MGALVLKTVLVNTKDGEPIYRLTDRLNLDLPGLGSARLRAEIDVRADFSVVRAVLETEEPRKQGTISHQTIRLVREGGKWLRSVSKNHGAPTITPVDLPERTIVLTPPVGVGERLARLVPQGVGKAYKLPAYDLETGLMASWQVTVLETAKLTLKGEPELAGLRLARREGPAKLVSLRPLTGGSAPLRILRDGEGRLITFDSPVLVRAHSANQGGPAGRVLAFLRAAARGDTDGLRRSLDLGALYKVAGGAADNATLRADFESVLIERLTDVDWLESNGLLLVADTTAANAFDVKMTRDTASVAPRGKRHAFTLERRGETWRIVSLPTR